MIANRSLIEPKDWDLLIREIQALRNKIDVLIEYPHRLPGHLDSHNCLTKNVLTFAEAVAYTGFSKGYLYKLTSQGLIPHSKPRGKIFFDRVKLEKWLLGNPVKTQHEIERAASDHINTRRSKLRRT